MKTPQFKEFNGLNNVTDPARLGLGYLSEADNVEITDTKAIVRRSGYSSAFSGALSGAYSTIDFQRLYVVDNGDLKQINPDMSAHVLRTGLSSDTFHATEINDQIYYSNGPDKGIINQDNSIVDWDWPVPGTPDVNAVTGSLNAGQYQVCCTYLLSDGTETGSGFAVSINILDGQAVQITNIPQVAGLRTQVYIAPANSTVFQLAFETSLTAGIWNTSDDQLGIEMVTQFLDPPPDNGILPTVFQGRMCLAEIIHSIDISIVWMSEPLGWHLFDSNQSFLQVPGEIVMMMSTTSALIIGTKTRIFSYDGTLKTLVNYGVVPGFPAAYDAEEDKVIFWSTRGLCSAIPFENMTQSRVSVAPGTQAGGAIIQQDGRKKFIVALQNGGEAFNRRGTT